MEENNNKFKTRMIAERGESKLIKDSSSKSLTHEEAVKEITEKTNEILKELDDEEQIDDSIEIMDL